MMAPEPVEHVWIGVGILFVSILLEGYSCWSNIVELNKRRGEKPFFKYLRDTTDSDLVVVFGENSAAVLGLALALAALGLAASTGDGRWDGAGSIAIGLVLVGVAVFLATEVSSLLLGESADPEIDEAARKTAAEIGNMERVLNIVTMQQGPGEVLVHVKIAFVPGLPIEDVCQSINDFEMELRKARPEVRWVFVEPDIPKSPSSLMRGDAAKRALRV
jgi:divalent metal cation (Fe/Co/Zn/Cd) transporter